MEISNNSSTGSGGVGLKEREGAIKQLSTEKVLTPMLKGDFETPCQQGSDAVKSGLPPTALAQVWSRLKAQCGEFVKAKKPRVMQVDLKYIACLIPIVFTSKAKLDLRLVFYVEGPLTVEGFMFVPHTKSKQQQDQAGAISSGSLPADIATTPSPHYANPKLFDEKQVVVKSVTEKGERDDVFELNGSLCVPQSSVFPPPYPVVVLVHGSGPNDLDETLGHNKPFRDIAHGLASKGIAVLRYNKRTKQYPLRCLDPDLTVKEETLDDVVSAIESTKQHPELDSSRVYVLGHSLGGYLLPKIAAHSPAGSIAGYIGLAPSARHLEDCVLQQVTYISSLHPEKDTFGLDNIRQQVEQVKKGELGQDETLFGMPCHYLNDLRSYEPAKEAKATLEDKPLLLLFGKRDYQVIDEDRRLWEEGTHDMPKTHLKCYDKLHHLFMEPKDVDLAALARPEEYTQQCNVAEEVVSDIARWILSGSLN